MSNSLQYRLWDEGLKRLSAFCTAGSNFSLAWATQCAMSSSAHANLLPLPRPQYATGYKSDSCTKPISLNTSILTPKFLVFPR